MQLRPWCILAALALGRVAFGYQFQTIASLADVLVPSLRLSYAQLGSLIGAYMLLGVFTALPLGLLGRRFGERWILGGGLAVMTLGSVVCAASGSFAGIALGRAVGGLGAVAVMVLQNKVIAEWFTGARFMVAISLPVCAFPVGVGLAQLILPWVAARHGLPAALLTDAVPAALAMLLFLGSHRAAPDAPPIPRRFSLPSARECVLLGVAGLAWMVYTSGFSAWTSYLPMSLSVRGFGLAVIGACMTLATWGNIPTTLLGGGLAARVGALNIFTIGTLALVVGMAGSSLFGWPLAWAALIGIPGGIQPGVLMAVATLSARPENRAVGMGLFYTLYYVGGTVAPALCGVAADYAGGPSAGMLAAAAISALALPLFLLHRSLAERDRSLARA